MKRVTGWFFNGRNIALSLWLILPLQVSGESVQQLAFMEGHWISVDDQDYEEIWMAPKAGTLAGSFRWVFGNGKQVLEYLIIQQSGEEIIFRFKHFDPDYTPWEKQQPNSYRLTSLEGNSATFERLSESTKVPKSITYARDGDKLSFIGLGDEEDDEPLVLKFRLKH